MKCTENTSFIAVFITVKMQKKEKYKRGTGLFALKLICLLGPDDEINF